MSKYNLTIIDVMTDGEHGDEFEIEGHHNHVMVYITLKKKLLNWVLPAKYEVVLDDFITDSKFRKLKPVPEIIKWYRARLYWREGMSKPMESNVFFESKQAFLKAYPNSKVQKWETIDAPEKFEDWSDE